MANARLKGGFEVVKLVFQKQMNGSLARAVMQWHAGCLSGNLSSQFQTEREKLITVNEVISALL